ncbi:uncharacterized protein LOC135347227 [Halichondria panicea]|uniref:uncharacterized protein LOC135347227 n=1 Tax=Halichondria panicea TaxID=6063 RepID=UPI00312B5500
MMMMKLLLTSAVILVLTVASIHGDPPAEVATLTVSSSVTFNSTETSTSTSSSTSASPSASGTPTHVPISTTSVTATPLPLVSSSSVNATTATKQLNATSSILANATTSILANATTSILANATTSLLMSTTPSPVNTTNMSRTFIPHTNTPTISLNVSSPPTHTSSQYHAPTTSTHSSGPITPTPCANVGKECTTSLAIAVGVSIPGTAIVTFFITSLACLCCQKVKKKRSYIRLAPTVYFDDDEDQD